MSNHPCGLCGELHFDSSCPRNNEEATRNQCSNCNGNKSLCSCEAHNHDNYAIIICDPRRGYTARDADGFTRATNEAHEVMRGFHDEVVVKHHHDPLGKLKSFAFYYCKGVVVAVIAPSKKVG